MQQTILLNATENTKQVEREEQAAFIHSVLTIMGVDEAIHSAGIDWQGKDMPVDDIIKMRKLLSNYQLEIVNDMDGGVKIFCEQQLIAEFKKPTYTLRQDLKAVDPRKKLYVEMKTELWSIFEDQTSDDNNPNT